MLQQSGGAVIISDVEALVTIQLCDFSFNTAVRLIVHFNFGFELNS